MAVTLLIVAGWLVGDVIGGAVARWTLAAGGGLAAIAVAAAKVRWLVAVPVISAAFIGALLGRGVVRALCLPAGCPLTEAVAAVLTGLGALVGVGLVVSLATRSFEEYRQASATHRAPHDEHQADGGAEH